MQKRGKNIISYVIITIRVKIKVFGIGSPVNRIPIMAKHVLDLYELYRLVVSKGGLVEVINKKLWREITKGLNLPSSITSAAFTLRTQYMKYLYPYECEKLKMSTPQELQSAIDGNRREGRRPVYGFEYASPSGMSNSGGGGGLGGPSTTPSSSLNISNPAAAAALNLVKSSSLQNDLINAAAAAGLSHQINNIGLHQNQHHPHHSLLQHTSQNPHHAAFFAAAAAAAAQHGHLYDPANLHSHQLSQLNLGSNAPGIPPFLKPYFELNTPPSSSSSSTSSHLGEISSSASSSSTNENAQPCQINTKSNIENENLSKISSTCRNNPLMQTPSQKRPFDHLDQNSSENRHQNQNKLIDSSKEPLSKKINIDNTNSKSLFENNVNQSIIDKMKVKILSKDSNENSSNNIEKSISISIEINGTIYNGTLHASLSSSSPSPSPSSDPNLSASSSFSSTNNNVSSVIPISMPESTSNNNNSNNKKFESSLKPDLVY